MAFQSVTDVMTAACDVQDALGLIGETEAATVLQKALLASSSTSTAALERLAVALSDVRPTVRRTLDAEILARLDAAVAGASALGMPSDKRSPLAMLRALFAKKEKT